MINQVVMVGDGGTYGTPEPCVPVAVGIVGGRVDQQHAVVVFGLEGAQELGSARVWMRRLSRMTSAI